MSLRKSRKTRPRTAINYELSEWDPDLPNPKSSLRKRSNSLDLLDELRRSNRKFHSRSQTAVARHSQQHCGDEYVSTEKNQPPNTTYAVTSRYNKEAFVKHCHSWEKTNTGVASRGTQADLKGYQSHSYVQCSPSTREMNVQTHKWRPDVIPVKMPKTEVVKTVEVPSNGPAPDFSGLIALIEARMKKEECTDTHVPENLIPQVQNSLADLLQLLRSIQKMAEVVDRKEDEALALIRNQQGKQETGIIELLGHLKTDHLHILKAIKNIGGQTPDIDHSWEEEYYIKILNMLREVLMILHVEEEEIVIVRKELYAGKCRCSIIAKSCRSLLSGSSNVEPSICQRCVNDRKGHTFIVSLKLPVKVSEGTVNVFGRIIECIESDDEFNLKQLLKEVSDAVSEYWEPKYFQIMYESLLLLSLLSLSRKCAFILAGAVDVRMMLKGMNVERHQYDLPKYVRYAVEVRDVAVLQKLLQPLEEPQRIAVINYGVIDQETNIPICPLFEAARNGDVDMFIFLLKSGASIDVKEVDKTIMHEIAEISMEKAESSKSNEWNKALVTMLNAIYDHAGQWWEKQMLLEAWSGSTDASRKNALAYLFSITNKNGLNALQYAAKYASPEIVKKMLYNPPYEFNPDPIEFGANNGSRGFVMDQIESRLARKNNSVFERMILRDPLDGAQVLSIEPFKSMIDDKWNRYRYFYAIWFVMYFCYMLIYTACAVQRPIGAKSLSEMYSSRGDFGRLIGEVFIIACIPLFFYGEIRDGIRIGFVVPRPWLRTGLFRFTNFAFVISTIAAALLRVTLNPQEEIALSLALLLGWINTVEFLGAWKSIGMFAIILHKVFISDVALKFAPVFLIMIAGTSSATFIIYQTSSVQPLLDYSNTTFWMTPYTLVKVSVALYKDDYSLDAMNNSFAVPLYLTFIFLFNFLLLGLAIAMMADTYANTRRKVAASWMWVKATHALLMDRRLPGFLCIGYRDNKKDALRGRISTKLRYLTRTVTKIEPSGKRANVIEHVVLLTKEDMPKQVTMMQKDSDIMSTGLRTSPRV